jgi:Predicted Zn-dependent hydrolases of the beta-lactamase fold
MDSGRKHLTARMRARGAGVSAISSLVSTAAPALWQRYKREVRRPILPPAYSPDPTKWSDSGLYAAWLGHSTVFLKIDGFTILTDPVFSMRAGIHLGPVTLGLKRLVAPALSVHKLPAVDLILLSHAHMDHFDLKSLRTLQHPKTTVITAKNTSDLLRRRKYAAIHEIGWGESVAVGPALIRGLEVNHWGARLRTDTWRGYNGYLIEIGRHRVLFAGDTADTDRFRKVAGNKSVDVAIMPIGAYDPWVRRHCTPEQAWRMAQEAQAEFILPIHHQTFVLSREPYLEPIERLRRAAGARTERIALEKIGQEFRLS